MEELLTRIKKKVHNKSKNLSCRDHKVFLICSDLRADTRCSDLAQCISYRQLLSRLSADSGHELIRVPTEITKRGQMKRMKEVSRDMGFM